METIVVDVPGMYGDHHIIEVRRILLGLPGVQDVYASSYLKTVEVSFDPASTSPQTITNQLDSAGYLHEAAFPQEAGKAAYGRENDNGTFFRHSVAYQQTGTVMSFAQQVRADARPIIPCPGMDRVETMED